MGDDMDRSKDCDMSSDVERSDDIQHVEEEGARYTLQNNVLHGMYYSEHEDVRQEIPYIHGVIHGEMRCFVNDKINMQIPYVDGKKHGVAHFYNNGLLVAEMTYTEDALTGESKYFNEEGNLVREVALLNGREEGVSKTYYPTGELFELAHYHKGVLDGEVIRYKNNGDEMSRDQYQQGKKVPREK